MANSFVLFVIACLCMCVCVAVHWMWVGARVLMQYRNRNQLCLGAFVIRRRCRCLIQWQNRHDQVYNKIITCCSLRGESR